MEKQPNQPPDDLLARARRVIDIEAEAVAGLKSVLNADFERAVGLMLACEGRVITTGMGKAGHIARKVAATLASTGTPSNFMHPAEAVHGDLGMLRREDLVLAFSYRGQTVEVLRLIPYIRHIGAPLIAVTSNPESELAGQAEVTLRININHEACPLNLAPTASTTAMVALGDTLALVLLEARGFEPDDYAIRHPHGSLGRRLLTKVKDLMHKGEQNAVVGLETPLIDTFGATNEAGRDGASVVDADGKLVGFVSSGDLKRHVKQGRPDLQIPTREVMTRNPKFTRPDEMAVKALEALSEHKIIELPVVDEDHRPVGVIHIHDIARAGIT